MASLTLVQHPEKVLRSECNSLVHKIDLVQILYNCPVFLDFAAETIPYDENRIQAFNEIYDLVENSFDVRETEIANIKLLNFVASFVFLREINPALQESDTITASVNFMKNNIHLSMTLDQLAQRQHLSTSHYCRLFIAKTGRSPHQYFNQLKIWKSCQYLYFSDRSIKEICSQLGFEDPYYFSRLFKKVMGISPGNYKNQHKKV